MLEGLLPVFEASGKTLVLRSWTVGVGQIGRLHIDPKIYDAVLGDIDSPALVVSTKFTAGDYFSYLPLNSTLASGRHRRLVELQAKPEFEGFGAFPDFLGEDYARALRVLTAVNPNVAGTYIPAAVWWAAPCGTANALSAARFLAVDRCQRLRGIPSGPPSLSDVRALTARWAEARFGSDARVVDAIARALSKTREAVRQGPLHPLVRRARGQGAGTRTAATHVGVRVGHAGRMAQSLEPRVSNRSR